MIVAALAIAGGLGALARYAVEGMIAPRRSSPFPLSTLVVNVAGSAALGALTAAATRGGVAGDLVTVAGTGFIGAFTTFSTFTYETVRLIEDGAWRYALWNLLLSGPLSFAAAGLTYVLLKG